MGTAYRGRGCMSGLVAKASQSFLQRGSLLLAHSGADLMRRHVRTRRKETCERWRRGRVDPVLP
jgi:hypothetical protein